MLFAFRDQARPQAGLFVFRPENRGNILDSVTGKERPKRPLPEHFNGV
jgi:hypothetical protein